jgi:RND family efflux transporter MFP subunit
MKLSNTTLSLVTVGLIFTVIGGMVAYRLLADAPADANAARQLPDTDGVIVESVQQFSATEAQPVTGVAVVRDTLWTTARVTGEADAYRRAQVSARTAGAVLSIRAREGQHVRQGQLLVQLDTVEALMNLEQARAAHHTAQNEYRVGLLLGGNISDPAVREERERNLRFTTGLHNAEVNLVRAGLELERTRIVAPFTGRVADIRAVEGAYVGAGAEVLTLVQLDPIKIEVTVPEAVVVHLAHGRRAQVLFTAIDDIEYEARIETVNPLVDPENRTSRVTLLLNNPGERIRPGMYATVSLEVQSYPDVILVPRAAITERDRRQVVFVLKNPDEQGQGRAEWRYVTTGRRNERFVEIVPHEETFMVEPGEIVLTGGHHYMAHDWPVRLVDNVLRAGGRPGR